MVLVYSFIKMLEEVSLLVIQCVPEETTSLSIFGKLRTEKFPFVKN